MKTLLLAFPRLILMSFVIPGNCVAQISELSWQKGFGTEYSEFGSTIIQTRDAGYLLSAQVSKSDRPDYHGGSDIWLIKLDRSGKIQWSKMYGGSGSDGLNGKQTAVETPDGGFVVAGLTSSQDGDVSGVHDTTSVTGDAWIFKIDSVGNIQWQKAFGGTADDRAMSLVLTPDSGFLVTGTTASNDGDVTGVHRNSAGFYWADIFVLKLSKSGTVQWHKCYGGTSPESAYSISKLNDGNYLVLGQTRSDDGDVQGFHGTPAASIDLFVLKIDESGNIIRSTCVGGSSNELNGGFAQKPGDTSFMLILTSSSTDGDFTGFRRYDYHLVRMDSALNIEWIKAYGGSKNESGQQIVALPGKGYLLGGISFSFDGDVGINPKASDSQTVWFLQVDDTGRIVHSRSFGGSGTEIFSSITATSDSGYIFAGSSASADGDLKGVCGYGEYDAWVVKMQRPTLSIVLPKNMLEGVSVYPTVTAGSVRVDFRQPIEAQIYVHDSRGRLIGRTKNSGEGVVVELGKEVPGMYFVTIATATNKLTCKILKQ